MTWLIAFVAGDLVGFASAWFMAHGLGYRKGYEAGCQTVVPQPHPRTAPGAPMNADFDCCSGRVVSSAAEPVDGAEVRGRDPRVPDPPADLLVALDATTRPVASAFWRMGYAAALDAPRTWRDAIPAGVRILPDPDYSQTNREG